MGQRTERDALGKLVLDSTVPRGIYTQRVIDTYMRGPNDSIPLQFIRMYIEVKMIYATVNARFKKISQEKKRAIHTAAKKLLTLPDDTFMKYFPVGQIQSGGGTSTNMMINEVLANEATRVLGGKYGKYLVKSHDDLNASQSSNDTFPGVTKLTMLSMLPDLMSALHALEKTCKRLARSGKSIKKVGRTHLQDAVTMTIGDEFLAYARTLAKNRKYILDASRALLEINFGGTAMGSLQNISAGIRKELVREMNKSLPIKVKQPKNYFEQNSSSGDIAWFIDSVNHCVNDLLKICNDIRLLSSGPLAGIHEIILPAVQPGSSIMPGKINPSVVEAATMLCAKIHGNAQTVQFLTRQSQLQLQQFMPQIAWSSLEAIRLLTDAVTLLNEQCFASLKFNKKRIAFLLDHSLAEATNFSEKYGYDRVAKAVVEALKTNRPLHEILSKK